MPELTKEDINKLLVLEFFIRKAKRENAYNEVSLLQQAKDSLEVWES